MRGKETEGSRNSVEGMCVTDLFFIDLGLSHQAQEVLGSSPDSASNLVSANMHLRGYQLVALVLT